MRSKKKRFVLQIIIVIVPVFILFSVFYYNQYRENHIRNFYEVGERITAQTSSALMNWIGYQVGIAKAVAMNDHVVEACLFPEDDQIVEEARKVLSSVHEIFDFYENVPLAVRLEKPILKTVNNETVEIGNGEFITDSVEGNTIGKGGLSYSYINEIFDGKEYFVSEIYPSILRGNPILVVSVPVIHNGQIVGVVGVAPQVESVTAEFVDAVTFKKTGQMFFIDERHMTISHPQRAYILSDIPERKAINERIVKHFYNGDHFFQDDFDDEERYYYVRKVPISENNIASNWYVVFTESRKEVLRDSTGYLHVTIIMSALICVITIYLIFLFTNINHEEMRKEELEKMNEDLEQKVNERTKTLEQMAMVDGLTELYNYKTAYMRLKQTISDSREKKIPFVLIIADLDHFKKINDTHGHLMGNEVLVTASKLISSDVRSTDIVGRYGGEEFIIVLTNINLEEGYNRAESIRKKVEEKNFSMEGVKVTISMGVCEWKGESASDLIKKADEALYRAKSNGRNRVEKA